jgi:hypothetical protein
MISSATTAQGNSADAPVRSHRACKISHVPAGPAAEQLESGIETLVAEPP